MSSPGLDLGRNYLVVRRALKDCTRSHSHPTTNRPHLWYGLAFAFFLIDQATKVVVTNNFIHGELLRVSSFFNLVHYRNPGAAFGFLSDAGGWQRPLLVVVALGVSVWLTQILRRRLPSIEALGYSLVLGGALGNLLDRVLRGSVVDYLDFYWRNSHWPAFNLADVAITLGVICILGSALKSQQAVDRNHVAG